MRRFRLISTYLSISRREAARWSRIRSSRAALPGLSAFSRNDAGEIFHTYARGPEELLGTLMILDRAPKGRNESSTLSFLLRVTPHSQETQMAEFMWYDLMTTDLAAAAEFYHAVTGVTALPPEGGMDYRVLTVANAGIGGMMPLSPEMQAAGMRPCWMGYVGVEDVDAEAARLQQEGGTLHRPPETIPGIVRFAVVSDPQGAGFMLLRGLSSEPFQRPPKNAPGTVTWHELHAKDGNTALDFYTRMFGWQKVMDHDMGSIGVYRMFNAGSGDAVGGLMTKMDPSPVPYWLFYTQVDAIDAAAERVKAHGGQILNGPLEVPGGDWVAQCLDPQGAMFALVGPKG